MLRVECKMKFYVMALVMEKVVGMVLFLYDFMWGYWEYMVLKMKGVMGEELEFRFYDWMESQLFEIWENYKKAIERRGREALEEERFIYYASNHAYCVREGDSYMFGGERRGMFIPSHFCPSGLKGGYRLLKELLGYWNVCFFVTEDLVPMLSKAGYWVTPIKFKSEFRNEVTEKRVCLSSLWGLFPLIGIVLDYLYYGELDSFAYRLDVSYLEEKWSKWDRYRWDNYVGMLVYGLEDREEKLRRERKELKNKLKRNRRMKEKELDYMWKDLESYYVEDPVLETRKNFKRYRTERNWKSFRKTQYKCA